MGKFLIDTNCVSAYLSGSLPKAGTTFMDEIVDSVPNLSIITQIELQCWDTKDKHIMRTIAAFIKDSVILNIDQNIVQICTLVRRGRKIKTPDAIIAATAISYGFTLITNNEKDFAKVPKLKVVNPYKMT